jgi:hypothetical protein
VDPCRLSGVCECCFSSSSVHKGAEVVDRGGSKMWRRLTLNESSMSPVKNGYSGARVNHFTVVTYVSQ